MYIAKAPWDGYIYDFYSILEANLDTYKTFVWYLDFPDLVNSRCSHKVNENMDLESQGPRFNANLGLDQNLCNLDRKTQM